MSICNQKNVAMKKRYNNICKKMYLFFLFYLPLLTGNLYCQLNGTYTIGTSGSEDYTTIADAVSDLSSLGINGSVVFNLTAGNYHEQILIPQITGASETNTIIFQSVSGDTADVRIYYEPSGINNYVIELNGADYITFKDLSLFAAGISNYGVVVKLIGNCNFTQFIGNHFFGKKGTSADLNDKLIVAANVGTTDIGTVFRNNKFENGKYGVSYSYGTDLVFEDNIFINGESDQLSLSFCTNAQVTKNSIIGPTKFSYNGAQGFEVHGNTLIGTISFYSLYPTENNKINVYNNFICGHLSVSSCSDLNIYYNSIAVNGGIPIRLFSGGSDYRIMNNIFKSLNAGYPAIDIQDISYIDTLDYNDLYSTGSVLAKLGAVEYTTLNDWQAATNQSAHSVNQDVTFDNWTAADLHISSGTPKLFGIPITEIVTDFDGEPRYLVRPNMGADEYTKAPLHGIYVIDAGGTEDYVSFSTAIADLTDRGIDSAVIFIVNAGTYNEQISIPEIEGASESNTITIQSATGDASDVTLQFNPATTDVNYTVHLAGADYIRFRNLSIFSTGASAFGNIIKITDHVKDIEFSGNHFYGKTGGCTFKDKYLVRDDFGSIDTSLVFQNNIFEHGNGALYFIELTNCYVGNNTFINGESFSLYFQQLENGIIERNTLTGNVIIYNPYGKSSNVVRNNIISGIIEINGLAVMEGNETLIYNNFVKGSILVSNCYYTGIYYNTVLSSSYYSLFIDNGSNHIRILNNIFKSVSASYPALYIADLTDIETEDYNNLYAAGVNLVRVNTTNYTSLADWRTASSMSVNSSNENISFVDDANTNLHIAPANPDLLGIVLSGITDDIDDGIRNTVSPNMGADEYSVQPMSGTYTIGKNGTEDYLSFSDAVEALIFNGISDYTYFEVSSGTYEEQISIPEITGASVNAGIVFYPSSGNRKDVIMTYTINDIAKNYIVNLNGADYIYFQKIEFIVNESSDYGVIINFNGNASYNGITYCDFTGLQVENPAGVYALIYSESSDSNDEFNIISNNTFTSGAYGVCISGIANNNTEKGNEITNNCFSGQYQAAIYLYFQDSCTVRLDSINITSTLSNPYGIFVYGSSREMIFNNNIRIVSSSATQGGYGIYIYDGTGEYNKRASVFNNFIAITTNSETATLGIVLRNTPYRNVYYNTINISGLNTGSQVFKVWGTTSESFYSNNNIFSNNADGFAFWCDITNTNFASDYNNFHTSGTTPISGYASLEEWQTARSRDQHSLTIDPPFISANDLHIYHGCLDLDSAGIFLGTGNSNLDYFLYRDIDLELRNNPSPDMGADEYNYISDEKDFLTFSFVQQTGDAIINADNHTISIEVEYGTDLSSLVATFTISENATVAIGLDAQVSGVTANDYSSPVIYTITAQDGSTQNWIVTVTDAPNIATDFISFSFSEQTGPATIDTINHNIDIEVEYGTDLTSLVASFTLSKGATAEIGSITQVSGITANDFSGAVEYLVTAENGTEQTWTVDATVALNSENDILSFSFTEQTSAAVINAANHTISIDVVAGTDLSTLVATFTLSGDATASVGEVEQVSGITSNDFSSPVSYTITSQSGDEQIWVVTVEYATGIEDIYTDEFALFPNPANDYIIIKSNLIDYEIITIEIIEHTGKVISKEKFRTMSNLAVRIDLNNSMTSGLYYIRIATSEKTFVRSFVIN